jgi:Fibronectin type III domain
MKTKLLLFSLVLFMVSCGEEGSEPPSPCSVPTPTINFRYEPDSVFFSWENAGNYEYGIRCVLENALNYSFSLNHKMPTDTFAFIKGVHPGLAYLAILYVTENDTSPILNRCDGKVEPQAFTVPCGPYLNLFAFGYSSTTARVSWSKYGEVPGRVYTINLRKKGTSEITIESTDKQSLDLTSLQPRTDYQVQLVYTCTDNQVYISEWKDFTTQ